LHLSNFVNFVLTLVLYFSVFQATLAKAPVVADTILVKGKVTILPPKTVQARLLKVGDQLIEDTSILTETKSVARLRFRDGSELTLGPNSKVVLTEMSHGDVSLVTLLKGKLRTKVEKTPKDTQGMNEGFINQNKFLLKTRSAAMGVRGTEFQTIYNPTNKVTSLLTFEGEVAMAKIDEKTSKTIDQLDDQKMVSQNVDVVRESNLTPTKVEAPQAHESNADVQHIQKILRKSEVSIVKVGQVSTSSDSLEKSTGPVKIHPVQFALLSKNNLFEEKAPEILKPQSLVEVPKSIDAIQDFPLENPSEIAQSVNKNDSIFRPGGVLDLETGLYISPDATAPFDEKPVSMWLLRDYALTVSKALLQKMISNPMKM
jgi:hypothetical protein